MPAPNAWVVTGKLIADASNVWRCADGTEIRLGANLSSEPLEGAPPMPLGRLLVATGVDAASGAATNASNVFARNVASLLELLVKEGKHAPPLDDDIVAAVAVTRGGQVVHPRLVQAVSA